MRVPAEFSPNPHAPALVIGSAGLDIVGCLREELHPGTSNPAYIRRSFGGVARNVAENLARLGQPVRLITAVGEDHEGDTLIAELEQVGVEVHAVMRTPAYPTGTYLAVVDAEKQLQFALDDMRVCEELTSEWLHKHHALFREASFVFVDANLTRKTLRTAFSLARRAGIPICADPTSVSLADRLVPFLSRLSLVTPNAAEANVLCGRSFRASQRSRMIEAAKYLVSLGVQMAIITLAQFGVCYATSETSGHIPAIQTEIVDPTGAGDAFTAALLFALLNDIPLDDAIRLGVSAATLTLRYPGTVLPDLTLERLYANLVI